VVAEAGAALCLMHMQGTPQTMQADPQYDDVVAEVLEGLAASIDRAIAAGVPRSRLWVDPGIGFGKTTGHNLFLLRHLAEFRVLGAPVLVGTSRKRFLGVLAGGRPPEERLPGTLASVAAVAVLQGADVVRVHDVAEAKDALAVADAIARAREGGRLWEIPGAG
jgi:dihydropteroate synthase